jgi:hypothetical protein
LPPGTMATSEMDVSWVDQEVLVDAHNVEAGDVSADIDETWLNGADHGKEDKVLVSIGVIELNLPNHIIQLITRICPISTRAHGTTSGKPSNSTRTTNPPQGRNTTSTRSSPAQSTNRLRRHGRVQCCHICVWANRQREDIHSRKPILSLGFYVQADRSLVRGPRTTGHNPSLHERRLLLQLLPPRANTSSAAPTSRSTTKASMTSCRPPRCPCRSLAMVSSPRSGRSRCTACCA